jgi:hypothetical protein
MREMLPLDSPVLPPSIRARFVDHRLSALGCQPSAKNDH